MKKKHPVKAIVDRLAGNTPTTNYPLIEASGEIGNILLSGSLEIQAAADEASSPRLEIKAYSGGALNLKDRKYPVYVELSGIQFTNDLPFLLTS